MTGASHSSDMPERTAVLRAVVLALGERATPPWWRTQFLSEIGLRTMARILPRTSSLAAIESTLRAARAEHDERIGAGRYHLFRLPEPTERGVAASLVGEGVLQEIERLISADNQTLRAALNSLAGGHAVKPAAGPISLGSLNHLNNPIVVSELAAHYWASFCGSTRRYPYFEHAKGRS